jgi:hypothetical protein
MAIGRSDQRVKPIREYCLYRPWKYVIFKAGNEMRMALLGKFGSPRKSTILLGTTLAAVTIHLCPQLTSASWSGSRSGRLRHIQSKSDSW